MTVPFHLLHTFVVVVRAKRMDRAAETLRLTPGAISQRIKQLEAQLQRRLLDRSRSGLDLTRSGAKLFGAIAGPFDKVAAGYAAVEGGSDSKRVRINTVPSFAASWLVPRPGRRRPALSRQSLANSLTVDSEPSSSKDHKLPPNPRWRQFVFAPTTAK